MDLCMRGAIARREIGPPALRGAGLDFTPLPNGPQPHERSRVRECAPTSPQAQVPARPRRKTPREQRRKEMGL